MLHFQSLGHFPPAMLVGTVWVSSFLLSEGQFPGHFAGWADGLMQEESPGVIVACWG